MLMNKSSSATSPAPHRLRFAPPTGFSLSTFPALRAPTSPPSVAFGRPQRNIEEVNIRVVIKERKDYLCRIINTMKSKIYGTVPTRPPRRYTNFF